MAGLFISPENQIQRLNQITNEIARLKSLPLSLLTVPPKPKAWSIIEIIAHLNIAYGLYEEKINGALAKCPNKQSETEPFKARAWQRFVINGQRPKGNVRKWKMKTLKKFEPLLSPENRNQEQISSIFDTFQTHYGHLRQAILTGRNKDLSKVKITSAIGPIVRFYLPECFEFLLCHAERHLVQINETKEMIS
ncbi:hypothetical protein FK220_006170 [Flavobacteriaceae bacterium TP-CH-4]|uniref:DinB-like domain-containing protein n=1 Tax=Pelagihabitans pacificus TaxID=2696054 RepID=A0A967AYJ1_9FLAO|nr:DinB family protein [Pelagihabitans pacificus]NHF58916.1 hypothetical protein [Pelagihabitans pacificus]